MENNKQLIDGSKLEQLRYTHIIQFWKGKLIKSLPISEAPSVDAVEVVHGRWIIDKDNESMHCSICGFKTPSWQPFMDDGEKFVPFYATKYCGNCGAKMDEC